MPNEVKAQDTASLVSIKALNDKAEAAKQEADANREHFWYLTTDPTGQVGAGAHISQKTQEEFLADPAHGGGNTLLSSGGLAVRDGVTDVATFSDTNISLGKNSEQSVIDMCDGLLSIEVGLTYGSRKTAKINTHMSSDYGYEYLSLRAGDALLELQTIDGLPYGKFNFGNGGIVSINFVENNYTFRETYAEFSAPLRLNYLNGGSSNEICTIIGRSGDETGTKGAYYLAKAGYSTGSAYKTTQVLFGIGESGINHGVYSRLLGKWLIYGDETDVWVNNYKLNLATNNTTDTWVLALSGNTIQHRVIPAIYNSANLNASVINAGTFADARIPTSVARTANFASGVESGASVPANGYKDFVVSFGKTFSSTPTVVATLVTTATTANYAHIVPVINARSTTGATIRVFNGTGTAYSPAVAWVAMN